jgi:hypothetical protein
MIEKIKQSLDEYLEFDSNLLFKHSNLVRIFGGAIRDIIIGDPIRDVDILCGSRSIPMLKFILESEGFHYVEDLCPKDLQSCYSEINIINEPMTFLKGSKIVQLIKPATSSKIMFPKNSKTPNHSVLDSYYKEAFYRLLSNVDISCCGVSYDGKNLYENYPSAITHIRNKSFTINRFALMYNPNRIQFRHNKFMSRGWTMFDNDDVQMVRDVKISSLVDPDIQNIPYIGEYNDKRPTQNYIVSTDDLDLDFEF